MYQKVDTNLNFVDREKKVEEFWKENHIFEKSMENRKEGETYTFYDGPPTANGKPQKLQFFLTISENPQKISLNTSMLFMIISQGAIKYSRY